MEIAQFIQKEIKGKKIKEINELFGREVADKEFVRRKNNWDDHNGRLVRMSSAFAQIGL